jgi:hypothetical protein
VLITGDLSDHLNGHGAHPFRFGSLVCLAIGCPIGYCLSSRTPNLIAIGVVTCVLSVGPEAQGVGKLL